MNQPQKNDQDPSLDTKTKILEVAYDLFDRKGYHVTSMREIATEAGLTKAALYYHFDSKKLLMIGILEMVSAHLQTNLFPIAYDVSIGEPEERLKQFFYWQEKSCRTGFKRCFIGMMSLEIAFHDEDFVVILNEIFDHWEKALTDLYSHFHETEKASMSAQQTIMEFEGAVMLDLVRKNKSGAIKNAISHAMARIHK